MRPEDWWWFTELVGELTYRPGWTFEAKDVADFAVGPTIIVTAEVQDAWREDGRALLRQEVMVPRACVEARDALTVQERVLLSIEDLEGHERLEWFRARDRAVWEPHRADGTLRMRPGA